MEIKEYTLRLFKNDKRKIDIHFFVTLTADNGYKVHLFDGEVVDKAGGNEIFLKLIAGGDYQKKVTTTVATDGNIIQYLMKNYDEYWMMSDDPSVFKYAPQRNKEILERVNIFKEIASWLPEKAK